MEGWTTFYLSKTSKKGAYISLKCQSRGEITELDKSGFSQGTFSAILSNFKALLDVSSFALNTQICGWARLRRKSGQNLVFMISSSLSIDPRYGQMLTNDEGQSLRG
jgi:hypothetical protein